MTGNFPSFTGRKISARSTSPSSIVMGTSQSIRMPSRISVRCCNGAITTSRSLPSCPELVAGIHVFDSILQDVDGRDKPGHDKERPALLRAPLHLGHFFQHSANSSGIAAAEPAFHRLEIDTLGGVENWRPHA